MPRSRCACCSTTTPGAKSRAPAAAGRGYPHFVAAVERLLGLKGLGRDSPIILMRQSGSRAPIAAGLLREAGFGKVYTQHQGCDGFETKQGPDKGKRVVNGWKNAGLR
ncbi:MAG: hypothetical protein OEN02_00780 [Gammaproteobacteria bacterium]|nr:hypothetical protein [Gammaproteobacteria bacterium]MDH3534822.1 hypothetical protein [Gammaproteobacteria bacterium]